MWGRDEDLETITRHLRTSPGRLVTITGRGGVGKTLLGLAVVSRMKVTDSVPSLIVGLEAIAEASQVVDSLVRALGLTGGPRPPIEAIAEQLDGTRTLLLLDNFEQVIGAAESVRELLDRTTDLRILVTSQRPLRLEREQLVSIRPLAVPDAGADQATTRSSPAAEMYRERVAAIDPTFQIDGSNAAEVGELLRQLGGLPLAIELAAARVVLLPAKDLIARDATARFNVLASTSVDVPRRQADLRAAISWTLELLTPAEQALFGRLSVIRGAFTIETAEALALEPDRVIDDLSTLIDVHLVDPIHSLSGARFAMPPAVRHHAAERLAQSGQTEATMGAHVRASAAWCRMAQDELTSSGQSRWVVQMAERYDCLLNCMSEALRVGAIAESLDLLNGLLNVWDAQGFNADREKIALSALSAATSADPTTRANVIVRSWIALLGLQHQLRSDLDHQLSTLADVEALARSMSDDAALAHVLACWVLIAPYAGFPDRSFAAAAEGLQIAQDNGLHHFVSSFEIWTGMLAHQTGDFERAVEFGVRALTRARESGDSRNVILASLLLRPLRSAFPELDAIVPTAYEALGLARGAGLTVLAALMLNGAASDAVRTGDLVAAASWVLESLAHARNASPPFSCYAMLAAIQLFAAWDERERVAWLDGALRSSMFLIEGTLSPAHREDLDSVLDSTRSVLGAEAYELAATRGRVLPLAAAARACESFVRDRVHLRDAQAGAVTVTRVDIASLTPRQSEVLRLLASGLTNREIATRLGLTPKTVMHHLGAVYQAIQARGRSEAVAWAFRHGLAG